MDFLSAFRFPAMAASSSAPRSAYNRKGVRNLPPAVTSAAASARAVERRLRRPTCALDARMSTCEQPSPCWGLIGSESASTPGDLVDQRQSTLTSTLGSSRAPSKGRGRHRRRSGARQAENCRSQNPGCTRSHGQLPHRFVSFRSNRLLCAPAPYRDTAPRPVFLAVSTIIAIGSFSSELVGEPNGHARRGDCSPGGQYCSADNRHRG